ncbi:MAG: glycosyltransferase [Planctomycetota bacterium]|jgi:dolichyl-phosphate beta-glucosyltransferase
MDISIVIPAFNESKKIAGDIQAASVFLENNNLTGEIIVVDDDSEDNTAEVAKNVEVSPRTSLKVEHYTPHRGKGYAVRTGIKATCGKYVVFADSGCCVPYENVLPGLELIKSGQCDIAHGSRRMGGCRIQKKQSLYRGICSAMFRRFVICNMKIPAEFTDTQCGFKIYNGNIARQLYSECITDGFTFDIEIIMRAQKEGYRIKEFPIEWTCDRDSRVSAARSLRQVLSELKTIKRALGKQ